MATRVPSHQSIAVILIEEMEKWSTKTRHVSVFLNWDRSGLQAWQWFPMSRQIAKKRSVCIKCHLYVCVFLCACTHVWVVVVSWASWWCQFWSLAVFPAADSPVKGSSSAATSSTTAATEVRTHAHLCILRRASRNDSLFCRKTMKRFHHQVLMRKLIKWRSGQFREIGAWNFWVQF